MKVRSVEKDEYVYDSYVRNICHALYVLSEHGDVLELLDKGPKDALLEVHIHAEVLAHLGSRVVALGGVDVGAGIVHEGDGLVLATRGLVEAVR